MGCDIHIYEEGFKDGVWHLIKGDTNPNLDPDKDEYEEFWEGRNYTLFGLIAGVRDSGARAFDAVGFPDDAAPETKEAYSWWGGDCHTPSHLYFEELTDFVMNKREKYTKFYYPNDDWVDWTFDILEEWVQQMGYDVKGYDDIRLVFWFDS